MSLRASVSSDRRAQVRIPTVVRLGESLAVSA
jgi:hypothetical protein